MTTEDALKLEAGDRVQVVSHNVHGVENYRGLDFFGQAFEVLEVDKAYNGAVSILLDIRTPCALWFLNSEIERPDKGAALTPDGKLIHAQSTEAHS